MSSNVPPNLIAGDDLRWTADYSDKPAPTFVVTTYFESKDQKFEVIGTASGSSHAFVVLGAATAAYVPGSYRWFSRAVGSGSTAVVDSGWIDVLPNPAASTPADPRSWAEITLVALEAALTGRATSDQLAMAINGRSISRIPLPELLQWRDRLKNEVKSEKRGDRAGLGRFIKVRLNRA